MLKEIVNRMKTLDSLFAVLNTSFAFLDIMTQTQIDILPFVRTKLNNTVLSLTSFTKGRIESQSMCKNWRIPTSDKNNNNNNE